MSFWPCVQRPVPATHGSVRQRIRQLVAFVGVIDVDLVIAPTGVDLQGAANTVPSHVSDELEEGLGFKGEQEEGGKGFELHCMYG